MTGGRLSVGVVALAILMLTCTGHSAAAAAPAAEWPGWRGPKGDGKSPDTGLLKEWPEGGPPLLWKIDSVGAANSSIAVSGDTIYVTGYANKKVTVFALDEDGKPKWQTPIDTRGGGHPLTCSATPTVDSGKVYVVSGNGMVVCLNATTGKLVWQRDMKGLSDNVLEHGYAQNAVVAGSVVVVSLGGKHSIVGLDKHTGRPVWSSSGISPKGPVGSCVAFEYEGVPLIAQGTHEGLVCVSGKNGALVFAKAVSHLNPWQCPSPLYSDGHVFWVNGEQATSTPKSRAAVVCMRLRARDRRVGASVAWANRDIYCANTGHIIHEGYVYSSHWQSVVCYNLTTGKKAWEAKAVGNRCTMCWADGMLYLYGSGGHAGLATCSPDGMQMKGEFRVKHNLGSSTADPVVIGGRLYLRYGTLLHCYDVKAK